MDIVFWKISFLSLLYMDVRCLMYKTQRKIPRRTAARETPQYSLLLESFQGQTCEIFYGVLYRRECRQSSWSPDSWSGGVGAWETCSKPLALRSSGGLMRRAGEPDRIVFISSWRLEICQLCLPERYPRTPRVLRCRRSPPGEWELGGPRRGLWCLSSSSRPCRLKTQNNQG